MLETHFCELIEHQREKMMKVKDIGKEDRIVKTRI